MLLFGSNLRCYYTAKDQVRKTWSLAFLSFKAGCLQSVVDIGMSDILLYSNFLFFKAIIGNMRVFSKNVEAGFGHFKLKTCLANMKKKIEFKD